MSEILILAALLRKLIKILIAAIWLSNPLMAADNPPVNRDVTPFSFQSDKKCSDYICIETNGSRVPDMFKKPDRFSQREQTDTWSTNDFDHSGKGIRLSIDH